ncbi:hypothetical protein [Nostoc sp.]|uniref:hypothetical protein n=1 Tax=Nostoc sp. TaxID=1180 RepID=UPI002FFC41D9
MDTALLIYFIEENPNYLDVTDAFFEAMFRGDFSVVTSVLTITEVTDSLSLFVCFDR